MQNRIAILIECDNVKSLGGSCERDVYNIYQKLISLSYNKSDIYIMTNNKHYFHEKNISLNVLDNNVVNFTNTLNNLKLKQTDYKSIYIHISGHGYQGPDIKNIELDGRSEQIVLSSGVLPDYDFYSILTTYVEKSKCIRVTVDTCHSGTFSNFTYEIYSNTPNQITKQLATRKNPHFLNAYSLSACSDNQLDSCDIGDVGFGGSLTVHLLEDHNLEDFLFGSPFEVKIKLQKILKQLRQEPILLCDN
jgi:hypothetical protein